MAARVLWSEQPADVISRWRPLSPRSRRLTNAWGDTSTQAWQGLRPAASATPDEMRQIMAGAR
jgi:hypothetical protein